MANSITEMPNELQVWTFVKILHLGEFITQGDQGSHEPQAVMDHSVVGVSRRFLKCMDEIKIVGCPVGAHDPEARDGGRSSVLISEFLEHFSRMCMPRYSR